jgi:hypothetical protein
LSRPVRLQWHGRGCRSLTVTDVIVRDREGN